MNIDKYKNFIDGARILLRDIREEDINENYYKWMNDSQINQYLESRFYPYSIDKLKEYVNTINRDPNNVFLAIIDKKDNKHIGNIKLGPINWIHRFAEVGILIGDKSYWGKGYATEAIKLVSNYAFTRLNLHKVTAGVYEYNIASAKAFKKAGFVQEGTRKSHYFYNGKYVDSFILGLVNDKKA